MEDRGEDAIGYVGDRVHQSRFGQALDVASRATGHSLGFCAGGNLFGGYDAMGSFCYMSTPSGQAGFTASLGGGGAAGYGGTGLVGLSVSNAKNGEHLAGTSGYVWAGYGEGKFGAGGSASFWRNDCGDQMWQATVGWSPGFRSNPIAGSAGGGASRTWTLGW